MHGLVWKDIVQLAPELTLVIAAVVMSLIDLLLPKQTNRSFLGWLAIVAMVISAAFICARLGNAEPVQLLNQSYRVEDFGNLMKLAFLGATALIVLMSIGSIQEKEPHTGEFYYLLVAALIGAMIMTSSADLITLFVGLELLSITSYILVGIRKKNALANEGAFKYVVLGGVSSATILYGMSFLYGITGSTNLGAIQKGLIENAASYSSLIYLAFFLLIAGLGFKIAVAPFHTWVPDVYQGASTPVTAFLAVVSKGAAFALTFRLVYAVFYGVSDAPSFPIDQDVFITLGTIAATAMIIGNVLALRQKNLKRLFAYSGIANSGYLLVPLALQFSLVHYVNFAEFYYYLIAYLFMNIGAFALIMMIERTSGHSELSGLAGLYYRAPATAVAGVLIVLSLAGLPVTGGFFGKLFIMLGAMETHKYWLGAIMIVTSIISYAYYFGLIRQMFMRTENDSRMLEGTVLQRITLWICALAGVGIGFVPHWILQYVDKVFTLATDLFAS